MALLIIGSERAPQFHAEAVKRAPNHDVRLWPEAGASADIRAALAWGPPPGELAKLENLKLIVSVGAGVDHLFRDPDLPEQAAIVRYVDPDLTGRMTEYVVLQTLIHTRRMLEFRDLQAAAQWRYLPEPAAHEIRVGIMGLGVLGRDSARALQALGFQVRGWSRSPKQLDGVKTFAGRDGLGPFLAETDVLVSLLPLTPDTRHILSRDVFEKLSTEGRSERLPGPVLINAGRGGLQNEADVLEALNARTLYGASLDVFETEPLPKSSPFWVHPRVVITPHNAAESATESIVAYFLRTVADLDAGKPLENVVDRTQQY